MHLTGVFLKTNGKNKMQNGFKCNEIIFSTTTLCNLHCKHCFVSRSSNVLDIKKCIDLIQSAIDYSKNNPDNENFIL